MLRVTIQFLREPHFDHAGLTVANDLRIPLHHLDVQTTTGAALITNSRPPYRYSRNQSFFGDEAHKGRSMLAAAFKRECCTTDGGHFQEISTFHVLNAPAPTRV